MSLLTGCSTGDGGSRDGANAGTSTANPESRTESGSSILLADEGTLLSPAVAGPDPLLTLQASPERRAALPVLADISAIVANSGLQVAWTPAAEPDEDVAPFIGAQWQSMQRCIGQMAPAPLVVLVDGVIEPISTADDVIRSVDGMVQATSNAGPIAILQVKSGDLGSDVANRGFMLRSIMGRHLWLSANLPERDYPYRCARDPKSY